MIAEQITEQVKAFPPLDDTVQQVMAVCNNPDGSVAELAKVVEKDPMTTANILKAANSPLYGFSREIKGITQAVSIFGMDTVKGFAFSSFLQKKPDLDLSAYGIDAKTFSHIAEMQNAFTSRWLKKSRRDLYETLALPSFLMEVGKIVLSNIVKEHGKVEQFKKHVAQTHNLQELSELERKVFGITNEEVTALLLQEWNFDESLYASIRYLNQPQEAKEEHRLYAAALQAVKTVLTTTPYDPQTQLPVAEAIVEQYGLDLPAFHQVAEEMLQLEPA